MFAIADNASKALHRYLNIVLFLTGTGVVLVFATLYLSAPERIGALEFGVFAVTAVILAIILRRDFFEPAIDQRKRAFREAFGDSSSLAAFSDLSGRNVLCSAALKPHSTGGRGTEIAQILDAFCDAPKSLTYRLLNCVSEKGAGAETCSLGEDEFVFTAEAFGENAILWRITPRLTLPDERVKDPAPETKAIARPPTDVDFDAISCFPVAALLIDKESTILRLNSLAATLVGGDAAPGRRLDEFIEGFGRALDLRIASAISGDNSGKFDLVRSFASERFLQISLRRIGDGDTLLAIVSDATELKTLEQKFVQSQKMQAVGQLAGGVAHDFNNLLTAIMGHCDLLSMTRDETDPDFEDLTQIRQNANRAAALVRQLLAFSRQQMLNPTVCQIDDVLNELTVLLNRLIGERIALEMRCSAELWDVWIDEQQFEQVILNLVVNARDAMPNGGIISVECENVVLERSIRRDRAVVQPGEYVLIRVRDEGQGIPEDVRAKAFEPFFTTKAQGEGTGLGLSTAYGIIKQTGGFIFIDSESGAGATFSIYLPRLSERRRNQTEKAEQETEAPDLTGAGRILLVEDEAPVRNFARRALEMRGYDVVGVPTGEDALELYEKREANFDVIISDIVMPGMDGPTWVRAALEIKSDLKVIFTSGYDESAFRRGIDGIPNCSFLAKPFSLIEVLTSVKTALGDDPTAPDAPARDVAAAPEAIATQAAVSHGAPPSF